MLYLFLQAVVKLLSGLLALFALFAAGALCLRKARASALAHLPRGVLSVLLACAIVATGMARKSGSRAPACSLARGPEPSTLVAGDVPAVAAPHRITDIRVADDEVQIGVAWPSGAYSSGTPLELFGAPALVPAGWRLLDTQTVARRSTNMTFTAQRDEACGRDSGFFRVENSPDSDGDGLSDARERLETHTRPDESDTDGDGLSDGAEVALGLDPRDPDTDRDGLPDGWEAATGLRPLDPSDGAAVDSDGDGLVNAEEMRLGTNPREPDTDGDGIWDAEETGRVVFGAELPDFDLSRATNAVTLFDASAGSWWRSRPAVPLPFAVWCGGVPSTNAAVLANGVVAFLATGREDAWPGDGVWNWDFAAAGYAYSDDHAVVAACWGDLYSASGTAIRAATFGAAPERWFVAEYADVTLYGRAWEDAPPRATFQIVVSEADPSTVHVRYLVLSNGFDFASATLGAQGPAGWPPLPVAYNVANAATNGMVISYRFGLGSDPLKADTDGDGLDDAEEGDLGTSPRLADTDSDGLPDKWELDNDLDPLSAVDDNGRDGDPDRDGLPNLGEYAHGTDPREPDTDGDALSDGAESGGITVANVLPWLAFDAATDLTAAISESANSLAQWTLPAPLVVQGVTVTNAVLDVKGSVYFVRAGGLGPQWSRGPLDLAASVAQGDALVVAPYWDYLYVAPELDTRIRAGTATYDGVGYLLVEYANVCRSLGWSETNAISFQVAIPTNGADRAYIRYRDVRGSEMDGRYASVGFQTFDGRTRASWCFEEAGRMDAPRGIPEPMRVRALYGNRESKDGRDGPSLQFLFGFGTDPTRADTDRDGLGDAEEIGLGTDPARPDTDGDGMADGWESRYADSGFDPLVPNVNDAEAQTGPDDDLDGDGLTNRDESEWGTDPGLWDTDDDGLDDGTEADGGSDPVDGLDQTPEQWVEVCGDLGEDEVKGESRTLTIPAGRTALACVFLASEEYPQYTGQQSRFNDVVTWQMSAEGVGFSGSSAVNVLDPSWDSAAAAGHSAGGLSPVIVRDARFISAPTNAPLEMTVTLTAKNVGDGRLPSTVAVGLFPLRIEQRNMPESAGVGGSTDAGTTSSALIRDFGVAYITGVPAAADLVARIKGLPDWLRVTWETLLTTERSERGARDNRMARPVELRGSADYLISAELGNEIVGGRCALTMTVGDFPPKTVQFFIRGKNPRDAVARAYIDANVDAEFRDFAWMIAKHESKSGSRVYNQFNPAGDMKELPNKTAGANRWGWGMCQIDKGQYGDSTAEVYDWHANVASMNVVLRDKKDDYTKFTRHYRNTYGGHQSWVEPENYTRTIQGCVVSAKTWAIMVLYNGAASVPVQEVDGHRFQSPIEFVPGSSAGTGQWIFHDNVNTYGNVIMAEQSQSAVE